MVTKVLLVDDSVDLLEMFASVLRVRADYEVMEASSAGAALKLLRDFRPDVIVTDLVMPEMSGLELISHLQNHLERPLPCIIAVSGVPDLEVEALARGAATFQLKPIDVDEVIAVIDSVLRRERVLPETRPAAWERRRMASERAEQALAAAVALRPNLRESVSEAARVLSRYFGGVHSAITILEGGSVSILASSDGQFSLGTANDPLLSLASDVIESDSALVFPNIRDLAPLLARGASKLQFLVAIPFRLPEGPAIGALMLLDTRPRAFDAADLAILQHAGRLSTEALRPSPGPVAFTAAGFLSQALWHRWFEEELARSTERRVVRVAMIETAQKTWDPASVGSLMRALRSRTALAEVQPKTLLLYEVVENREAESGLESVIADIEAHVQIAYTSTVTVSDLPLPRRADVVLAISEAVLDAARRGPPGSRMTATVRPEPATPVH